MEIIVNGVGIKEYCPDTIKIYIRFETVGLNCNDVFRFINNMVLDFTNNCLLKNNFNENDLRIRNFFMRENKKYDDINKKYVNEGFICEQEAEIEFCYSNEKLFNLLNSISNLENAPFYNVEFFIKEESIYREEVIKLAYNDAYIKAKSIASASNKKLVDCIKVDFKPINENFISETSFNFVNNGVALLNNVNGNFNPKNIKIVENLYCLWNAE